MSNDNQHLETFKVMATGSGWPTSVTISDTEWTIQLDEPEEDGGANSGANPMQHFAAALAGCQNEQARVVADELGLGIGRIDISLEVDLDLAGFMGEAPNSNGSYKQVRLEASVHGADLSAAQIAQLAQRVDDRCPILALLRNAGCSIQSSWSLA